jgi:hypothetical protein
MEISSLIPLQQSPKMKIKESEHFDFFFDCKVIMQGEFVPPGGAVNVKFYLKILEHLR